MVDDMEGECRRYGRGVVDDYEGGVVDDLEGEWRMIWRGSGG